MHSKPHFETIFVRQGLYRHLKSFKFLVWNVFNTLFKGRTLKAKGLHDDAIDLKNLNFTIL